VDWKSISDKSGEGSEPNELERLRAELERLAPLKARWVALLRREAELAGLAEESRAKSRRLETLENQNRALVSQVNESREELRKLERRCDSYQKELQAALVRLHSSESRFAELTRQLAAFREARKTFEEEVARVENTVRTRLEMEFRRESEAQRVRLEQRAAEELERQRRLYEERLLRQATLSAEVSAEIGSGLTDNWQLVASDFSEAELDSEPTLSTEAKRAFDAEIL
jgi:chromosome segregation ATPase